MSSKSDGRSRPNKSNGELAMGYLRKHGPPKFDLVFNENLKMLKEAQRRALETMYDDNHYDNEKKRGRHDGRLLKDILEISKILKVVGELQVKMNNQAMQAANAMTFEERLEAYAAWVQEQGAQNRIKAIKSIQGLLYTLEKSSSEWKATSYATRRGENDE